MNKELPALIKRERTKKGLTQLSLSKMAGLAESTICRMEQSCDQFKMETVSRVIKALKIKPRYEAAATAVTSEDQQTKKATSGAKGSGPIRSKHSNARLTNGGRND